MPGRLETEIVHNEDGSIGVYGNGTEFFRFDGANLLAQILSGGSWQRPAQERQVQSRAKVGGTAGWTVGAADDLPYMGTVAASQTAATLVVPIDNLKVGETITGFKVVAQIESGGNTVTLDADLRKVTNAAGEPTDASVGTITQVSVTEDTAVSAEKTGLSEVVGDDEVFYVLLTATTNASTDIILLGLTITVTED